MTDSPTRRQQLIYGDDLDAAIEELTEQPVTVYRRPDGTPYIKIREA